MLGSGKTPVGHSREEKRTAEPGRRLGKSCFFSDTKCAIITQQSEQIIKNKKENIREGFHGSETSLASLKLQKR